MHVHRVALPALLLVSAPATAETQVHEFLYQSPGFLSASPSIDFTLPAFDPGLGTLKSVTIELATTVGGVGSYRVTHFTIFDLGLFAFFGGVFTVSGQGGSDIRLTGGGSGTAHSTTYPIAGQGLLTGEPTAALIFPPAEDGSSRVIQGPP